MNTNEDKIKLKEDYINEKYLNRNGDGYYLKIMCDTDGWTAYIFREGEYDNEVISHNLPSNFNTLESLECIENKYKSELMQQKIDIASKLTRADYIVKHQSVLSTMSDIVEFSSNMIINESSDMFTKYMTAKYCIIFEDDGTLTLNVAIKYTTVYVPSQIESSSSKYKTVDGDLIKGTFSRSIYVEDRYNHGKMSFADEFRIEGIKNFDIDKVDEYTNELFKLTENNDWQTIIIENEDQFDFFMEIKDFVYANNDDLVSKEVNGLIREYMCFEDFKLINNALHGNNTSMNVKNTHATYNVISGLFKFAHKVIKVTDYKATRDITYFDIYGEPGTKELECNFELEVSKGITIKCVAWHNDDEWTLEELTVNSYPSDIKVERNTRVEYVYIDEEPTHISEMVLYSRTLEDLSLDVNETGAVLKLFSYIEELLRGITVDVKELLQIHERGTKLISDSVEILRHVNDGIK